MPLLCMVVLRVDGDGDDHDNDKDDDNNEHDEKHRRRAVWNQIISIFAFHTDQQNV